jgi:hypothetical protein
MRPRRSGDLDGRGRSDAESVRPTQPIGGSGAERFTPHLGYLSRRDRRPPRSCGAFFPRRAVPQAESAPRGPRRESSPLEKRRSPERALRCVAPGRIRGSHFVLSSGHARTINNERPEGNRKPRSRSPHRGGRESTKQLSEESRAVQNTFRAKLKSPMM